MYIQSVTTSTLQSGLIFSASSIQDGMPPYQLRIIWLFKQFYIFLSTEDSQILYGLQREKLQGCVVKVYTTSKSLKRTVTGK